MDDELYREMDPEDPFYMGSRFCRDQKDGSLRCSVTGRRISVDSEACANYT